MSIRVVYDACRAIHHFADHEADRRFACRRCGRRLTVPQRVELLLHYRPAQTDAAFCQDGYTIPRGSFLDRYEVCDRDDRRFDHEGTVDRRLTLALALAAVLDVDERT